VSATRPLRLGVNIDHVATIRNARGGEYPDPVRAARIAEAAGASGITLHVREDRRHINEGDLTRLAGAVSIPINLEMACTDEMLAIALAAKPHAVCLVAERREEITTEGGLDAAGQHNHLAPFVRKLRENGARVSLFIDPDKRQLEAAVKLGAPVVELHTGPYCHAAIAGDRDGTARELERLRAAAAEGARLGLEVHAGHGLTFDTVEAVAAIPQIAELNIGHFLIGEAIFIGLAESIARMRRLMLDARAAANAA
jgi:pyridoxine 5-phosphate synthase